MNYGMTNPTKRDIKISMPNGQRKTRKHFTVIKTMQKWTPRVSL
jgi:hypothetical protein